MKFSEIISKIKTARKVYNVLIVGAGSIGAMKDDKYDYPGGNNILTIAHAADAHPKTQLVQIIDSNKERLIQATKKWNCAGSLNIKSSYECPIVAVCTPTESHHDVIKQVIKNIKGVKVILAEKPFCSNIKQAKQIKKLCEKNNIVLLIDYIRNYDPGHQLLASKIWEGAFGVIYNVTVQYTRGMIHEACHAINLMNVFFGKCKSIQIPNKKALIDRDKNDPTRMVVFNYEQCPNVVFMPVGGRAYSIFEITIMTEKGKIVITDHGKRIDWYGRVPEPTYGSYDTITDKPIRTKTELTQALSYYVGTAVNAIELPDFANPCSVDDALEVHHILEVYKKLAGVK